MYARINLLYVRIQFQYAVSEKNIVPPTYRVAGDMMKKKITVYFDTRDIVCNDLNPGIF